MPHPPIKYTPTGGLHWGQGGGGLPIRWSASTRLEPCMCPIAQPETTCLRTPSGQGTVLEKMILDISLAHRDPPLIKTTPRDRAGGGGEGGEHQVHT